MLFRVTAPTSVIPAKAGTHWFPQQVRFLRRRLLLVSGHIPCCGKLICEWVPAFAGMTMKFEQTKKGASREAPFFNHNPKPQKL
ncbi:MAG: hypothetical protein RH951_14825, partial [Parvibaculum sp.]